MTFCPELQQPWQVDRILARNPTELTLHLTTAQAQPKPDAIGRTIEETKALPQIYISTRSAVVSFSECISIHIYDEAHQLKDLEGTSEGKTFCRITGAPAITAILEGGAPRTPLHYRIITQDTIYDIICNTAPTITLSPPIDKPTPMA